VVLTDWKQRWLGHRVCLVVLLGLAAACNAPTSTSTRPLAPAGMVHVGGPATIAPYFMDVSPVTVADFDEFVKQTSYVSEAQRFSNAGVFTLQKEGGKWWMGPIMPIRWGHVNLRPQLRSQSCRYSGAMPKPMPVGRQTVAHLPRMEKGGHER